MAKCLQRFDLELYDGLRRVNRVDQLEQGVLNCLAVKYFRRLSERYTSALDQIICSATGWLLWDQLFAGCHFKHLCSHLLY